MKKKNSGKSVYLCIFIDIRRYTAYVQNSGHTIFVTPSSYFLLIKHSLRHFLSTVHFIPESKVKKNVCEDHDFCKPWVHWYILIHTWIYMYILVHAVIYHTVLRIRLEPPCIAVWSGLHACAVHRSQHPSSLQSAWCLGLPDGAFHAQTATATGLTL